LSTTKSFTKQRNVWKLEANGLKNSKGNQSNAAQALSDDQVNILYKKKFTVGF